MEGGGGKEKGQVESVQSSPPTPGHHLSNCPRLTFSMLASFRVSLKETIFVPQKSYRTQE